MLVNDLIYWSIGKIKSVKSKHFIHRSEKQSNLLLFLSGNANVAMTQKLIAKLERGSFISEVSFLTG